MTTKPAHLPARAIGDVDLADRFGAGGCPLCREAERAGAKAIDGMLGELVNDIATRAELDRARGFCRAHAHQVLVADRRLSGGMLGSSILFASIVRGRLRELGDVLGTRGRTRASRVRAVARPPACPICAVVEASLAATCMRLVELVRDAAWATAIGDAELCLHHLGMLLAHADGHAGWRAIEARQVERLTALSERLERFGHHSSHDRRHLMTADEQAAVAEAARFLGGGS